jgi:hypothetical protein
MKKRRRRSRRKKIYNKNNAREGNKRGMRKINGGELQRRPYAAYIDLFFLFAAFTEKSTRHLHKGI